MSVRHNLFGAIALPLPVDLPDETEPTASSEQPYFQDIAPISRQAKSVKVSCTWPNQQFFTIPTSYVFSGFGEFLSLGNFANVVSEVENLSAENEVPPTDFAYLKCRSVVGAAYGLVLSKRNVPISISNIPKPVIVTDDMGGIRLAWHRGNKTVRANFGATPIHRSYTYFESDTEHGVTPLDGASLSDRLNWLVKR